jgi:hypothetical protein
MEMKVWLVRAATFALVGALTTSATAQKKKGAPKGAPKPAPAAPATTPAEPQKPPASTTPEKEEEGPFAPTGKTGKLREEAKPEPEEKPKAEKPVPPPPEKPGAAGLDMVFGFGKTGGTTGPDATELSVVSFLLGGSYHFTPEWGARLRIPFATGKITHVGNETSTFEPLNEGYNAAAFGNIELAGNYTFALGPSTKLPLEMAFTVPTANGDRFPPPDDPANGRHYRINAASQASRGFEEDALFAPHRFGIIPKGSISYKEGAIDTGGFVKVPILIKAGGQPVPPQRPGQATFTLNSTVIAGVIGGDFHYGFVENKIDIGTRAWIDIRSAEYYDIIYPGGNVTTPSKVQFVLEPQVRVAIGPVRGVVGFIWPLGGPLGGDQQVNGLRLSGAYVF